MSWLLVTHVANLLSCRYHKKVKKVCSEMSLVNNMFIVLSVLLLDLCGYLVAENTSLDGNCPIWHIRSNDVCKCGANLERAVSCDIPHNVLVVFGSCMTWIQLIFLKRKGFQAESGFGCLR